MALGGGSVFGDDEVSDQLGFEWVELVEELAAFLCPGAGFVTR